MQTDKQNKGTVLLLLSGGRDSRQVLEMLVNTGHQVYGLCIDGSQGLEKVGAQKAADDFNVDLTIAEVPFFDEQTWSPLKLVFRDLAMGVVAIRTAYRVGAGGVVTGVKTSDINDPRLWWLRYFLSVAKCLLRLFGLRLQHPLWSESLVK